MGIRCEVCDSFLNIFQLSRLCEDCYKIRTITKCYSSSEVLDCLEKNFKVDYLIRTKSLPDIKEEDEERPKSTPVASNDIVLNDKFKKELEEKVIRQIETRNSKKKNKSH